ncbi:hypothetical protein, partial [Pseudomonas aeruginosa]|uniref:hypothetical protein n=1 Tax=Pseudomonas aeruginosa TaxID=287 RepID=UPI0031B79C26
MRDRGAIRDRHPGEFACLTLGFLLHEGISHTQTATGEDEVAVLDSLFEQFNASEKTAYRLADRVDQLLGRHRFLDAATD